MEWLGSRSAACTSSIVYPGRFKISGVSRNLSDSGSIRGIPPCFSDCVQKYISPENIIILHPGVGVLGTPLLVGFERFRFDEQRTNIFGDDLWRNNLYRHPARQGLHLEEIYNMRHDIYSIGVCLLEIGLWSSFKFVIEDVNINNR